MTRRTIRILGIDPGLRRTGWGVVESAGNRLSFIACGSVATDDDLALAKRLVELHEGLVRVVDEFRPDEAAVEATFVNKDATATLKLGQARGIALLVPARAGVGVLLPKSDPQSNDAADALAIAITHAHHRDSAVLKAALRSAE
jgi:crossover junction endodeoxyribonuclease RuvC